MVSHFLDNTVLLLAIGIGLMAIGVALLIWLLWPRSSQQAASAVPEAKLEPADEVPPPVAQAADFESEWLEEAEGPALGAEESEEDDFDEFAEDDEDEEGDEDDEDDDEEDDDDLDIDEPLQVSELEDFDEMLEEQTYLNLNSDSEEEDAEYNFMDTKDAIPVKLDLARAYLEMGDFEAVHETLKTVLLQGSKAQQREAELLLEQARLAQGD